MIKLEERGKKIPDHFVQTTEYRHYTIQSIPLELKITPLIFPPSAHGLCFAEHLIIHPGETVIDIGTGSGLLGILAAKLGGEVCVTDTDADAISVTHGNAMRNDVKITSSVGPFFAGFNDQTFDVIVANLPQEILPPAYQQTIGEKLTKTVHGGECGNECLLELFGLAKHHMRRSSRLYTLVSSLSDYQTTFEMIREQYRMKILYENWEPQKDFVPKYLDFYLNLEKHGLVKLIQQDGIWKSYEYIVELTLN